MARHALRPATVAVLALAVLAALWWTWRDLRTHDWPSIAFDAAAADDGAAPAWRGDARLVADPSAGHRVRASSTWTTADGARVATGAYGLIAPPATATEVTGPRVLVVGSERTADALACRALLEATLRAHASLEHAHVLLAACADYSLHQSGLRAATLMRPLVPQALLVVVDTGRDLDRIVASDRPHLDANGLPAPATGAAATGAPAIGAPATGAPGTSAPATLAPLHVARCVEQLDELARRHGSHLLVAALPAAGDDGGAAGGAAHDLFLGVCRDLHVSHVDLREALLTIDPASLTGPRPDAAPTAAEQAAIATVLGARLSRILARR